MSSSFSAIDVPGRRNLLKLAAVMATASPLGVAAAQPASTTTLARPQRNEQGQSSGGIGKGRIGYMLAHEQFPVHELVELGNQAASGGFHLLATSDHLQPWQANEGHSGQAWVTLGALSSQVSRTWMGTTVTCPILRYSPAVVAEAFASMSHLAPGRIFLGVGSGEALERGGRHRCMAEMAGTMGPTDRGDHNYPPAMVGRSRVATEESITRSMRSCMTRRRNLSHC